MKPDNLFKQLLTSLQGAVGGRLLLATLLAIVGVTSSMAQEPYVVYTPDNTTLTFYYDGLSSSREGTIYGLNENGDPAWRSDGTSASVTNVVIDPSFADARPITTMSWFCDMLNLENIVGLDYLNTSEVTNMMQMFAGCSKLTNLDLSGWDVENLSGAYAMFAFDSSLKTLDLRGWKTTRLSNTMQMFLHCSSLTTIFVSEDWTNANIGNSGDMFYECTSLKGYQGTTYDADHVDATYARLDGGTSAPGYFSELTAAPYAVLSTDGSTLTFYYDKQSSTREGTICPIPWTDITPDWYYRSFTTVTFDESFDAYHDLPTASYMFDRSKSLTTINNIQYLHTDHVTDMSYMFSECEMLTTLDVSYLNTSNVTTMRSMFSSCKELEDIIGLEYFNTSNVTDMRYMFSGDWALTTIDVSHFDVQEGCNLEGMFYNNINLTTIYSNSSWSDDWHASDEMFKYCYKLVGGNGTKYDGNNTNKAYARPDDPDNGNPGYFTEKPLPYAVVSSDHKTLTFCNDGNYTKEGLIYMLNGIGEAPGWNNYCSGITTVVFESSFADVRPITTAGWFYGMQNLEKIIDMQNLNTSKVTDMSSMFTACSSLTELDLSYFDTSKVRYMYAMFVNCTNLTTIYVSNKWSTAAVAEHGSLSMFGGCNNLVGGNGTTYDSNHLDAEYARIDGGPESDTPGYLTLMSGPYAVLSTDGTTLTFYNDENYDKEGTIYYLNSVGWNSSSSLITTVVFDSSFASARPVSTAGWFNGMSNLTTITGMEFLNTSEVTDMTSMFSGCINLTTLDLSHFDTSKVTAMNVMFASCSSLTTLDLCSFNTASVINMNVMFVGCTNLTTIYVGSGWSTADVNGFSMFGNCTSLVGGKGTTYDENHIDKEYAHVDGGPSYPGYFTSSGEPAAYAALSSDGTTLTFYHDNQRGAHPGTYDLNTGENEPGWYTEEKCPVTTVVFDPSFADARPVSTAGWFCNMENLTDITDMKYLNTSEVTNMISMFAGCSNLPSLDVSNFNTAKVTDMSGMFLQCSSLTELDLSCFNTANVTGMDMMFVFSANLKTIYVSDKWSTDKVTLNPSIPFGMFGFCESLVGGNGTEYNEDHIGKEYARIDVPGTPGYFTYKASILLGDVNGDGEVNVADITALTNYLLSGNAGSYNLNAADLDGSGKVTKADISALVQLVLNQ